MPDDAPSYIRTLLARAGVEAAAGDVERVAAIVALTPPRPAPRLESEPQLVQAPGDWTGR